MRSWFLLIACIGMAVLCLPWDLELSYWFRSLKIPGDLNKFIQMSEAFAHFLTIAFVFGCLLWTDVRNRSRLLIGLAFVLLCGAIANAAKGIVPRVRPNAIDLLPIELAPDHSLDVWGTPLSGSWFDEHFRSFPSGHSATAMAVAIALTTVYPRGKWFFVSLAVVASVQRVESASHYFSDVLSGVAITLFTGLFFWPRVQPRSERIASADRDLTTIQNAPT
ncbi:phosphatase PAP2 family protein [Pirellulaceae bacterium SH467]|jgi:membrane-associated phospholipid phosphatase